MSTLSEVLAEMRAHTDAPEWLDAAITDAENAANDLTAGYNATVKQHETQAQKDAAEVQRLRAENYRLMTTGTFGGEPGKGQQAQPEPADLDSDAAKIAAGRFDWKAAFKCR